MQNSKLSMTTGAAEMGKAWCNPDRTRLEQKRRRREARTLTVASDEDADFSWTQIWNDRDPVGWSWLREKSAALERGFRCRGWDVERSESGGSESIYLIARKASRFVRLRLSNHPEAGLWRRVWGEPRRGVTGYPASPETDRPLYWILLDGPDFNPGCWVARFDRPVSGREERSVSVPGGSS